MSDHRGPVSDWVGEPFPTQETSFALGRVQVQREHPGHEPHLVAISGDRGGSPLFAADPTTPRGAEALSNLITSLITARDLAEAEIQRIYGVLAIGERSPDDFRAARDGEERCQHVWGELRCSRLTHNDHHHVRVSGGYVTHTDHGALAEDVPGSMWCTHCKWRLTCIDGEWTALYGSIFCFDGRQHDPVSGRS